MKPFIIPSIVENHKVLNAVHFPLPRAAELHNAVAKMFSAYLGCMQSGHRFESEILLVTGLSGAGKTKELGRIVQLFNDSALELPDGRRASIVPAVLNRSAGWKYLGQNTLKAMGYPVSDRARLTQPEIWQRVVTQAKGQGIVGVH